MNHYNIVLLPPDDLVKKLTGWAQELLGDIHNGYCLEVNKVFPHITLAQFKTQDNEIEPKVLDRLKDLQPDLSAIAFNGFYMTPRHGHEELSYWCGLEVKNSKTIQKLHENLVEKVKDLPLIIRNPINQEFWPHLTLGRIGSDQTLSNIKIPPELLSKQGFSGWRLGFGHSDGAGQYIENIKSF